MSSPKDHKVQAHLIARTSLLISKRLAGRSIPPAGPLSAQLTPAQCAKGVQLPARSALENARLKGQSRSSIETESRLAPVIQLNPFINASRAPANCAPHPATFENRRRHSMLVDRIDLDNNLPRVR